MAKFSTIASEERIFAEQMIIELLNKLGFTIKRINWHLNGKTWRISAAIYINKEIKEE